jgi:serine/threonine-protein kinase
MRKLGISPGDTEMAIFPGGEDGLQRVTVRESTPVETVKRGGELGLGQLGSVRLTGRLHLGPERVYGRFTQAQTHTGETYPVCLELVHADERTLGARRMDVGGPADTAVVVSTTYVRAVERFE